MSGRPEVITDADVAEYYRRRREFNARYYSAPEKHEWWCHSCGCAFDSDAPENHVKIGGADSDLSWLLCPHCGDLGGSTPVKG